jgi:cholinesterase
LDRWFGVSKTLGCGGEEAEDKTLACMRKKSYQEILDGIRAQGQTGASSATSGFRPTADGKVVFKDYRQRLADGNLVKAPVLVGNNDDEAGLNTALAKVAKPAPKGPKMVKRQSPTGAKSPLQCGAHNTAYGRVKLGIPAWRYLFKGVYPNSVSFNGTRMLFLSLFGYRISAARERIIQPRSLWCLERRLISVER